MYRHPAQLRGALLTAIVCVAWFVLAWRNPELHYHFAPLIAATVWPLSLRTQGAREVLVAVRGAIGAAGLTVFTTVAILIAGNLDGPNFLHRGPAWPEAILFALVGAVIGARTASRARAGILGSIVDTTV